METIQVKLESETPNGWNYAVTVGGAGRSTRHSVSIDRAYYEKITAGKIQPDEWLVKSFEFLLQRESKESILGAFGIDVIQRYFSDYESTMKKAIGA